MRRKLFSTIVKKTNCKKKTRQGQSHNTKYGNKNSKKYYKKRAVDKRPQGARSRHLSSIHTPEFGTPRTTDLGFSGLKSLSVGISEHNEPNYRDEEKRLTEISAEVKTLITELENKKDEVEA